MKVYIHTNKKISLYNQKTHKPFLWKHTTGKQKQLHVLINNANPLHINLSFYRATKLKVEYPYNFWIHVDKYQTV